MDIFKKITSLDNLFDAWAEFRKEKANKKDVAEFEISLEDHIFQLHEELKSGVWRHGGYVSFFIRDPKRRHIHKASVCDRLLHHAIHRVIEPAWNNIFIFDSWSSRKTKGNHGAVKRLQDMGLRLSKNYSRTLWVLKLDIMKFFASVNHGILLGIIQKHTHNSRLMNLLHEIVESFEPGLPLGNLTSQLFANIYMNELDQFVKHQLKIQGYIRYADDFLIMHPDKETLKHYASKIIIFLNAQLLLKIHPQKITLKTYASGVDWLGFVCFPRYRVMRTKTKQRMFHRINEKNFASYYGILCHCRSYQLKEALLKSRD